MKDKVIHLLKTTAYVLGISVSEAVLLFLIAHFAFDAPIAWRVFFGVWIILIYTRQVLIKRR